MGRRGRAADRVDGRDVHGGDNRNGTEPSTRRERLLAIVVYVTLAVWVVVELAGPTYAIVTGSPPIFEVPAAVHGIPLAAIGAILGYRITKNGS